jgi:hypothetical protein
MIDGIKALLGSEKALVGGSLVIAATVLVALGHMTVTDWETYTQGIFYGYVGGKTLTSAVSMWASTKKPDDKPVAVEVPAKPVEPTPKAEETKP